MHPYKSTWTMEDVPNEVREMSASSFDLEVVKVFVENINEIIKIKQKYLD